MAKLFLITGVSTGFGRALAEAAVKDGHRVVGTVRKQADKAEFEKLKPGSAFAVVLDVTDTPAIKPAVDKIEKEIGAIDVLVNNAGYGHEGTV
ncbi:MAG TPA: SDR family NAD(P)-dependent oxidoreductase, partial [Dongiaceae bacterium]